MTDLVVIAGAVVITAGLGWFFFGPRKARAAKMTGKLQEVTVVVKGGYSPDLIRVRQGIPLRMLFDRQESGEGTSRVVFSHFAPNPSPPPYATTAGEVPP